MRSAVEVSDIITKNWSWVLNSGTFNGYQIRTLKAIKICRTASLGGHVDACTSCGVLRVSYNSCRNRHCPKCQGNKREEWIRKREDDLLPVPYFHVVFTLPSVLNEYAIAYPREVYSTLFESAWRTVEQFGTDAKHLGAKTGMISVLHTWGQNLSLHPHLHCIIPGGGVTSSGHWKYAKSKGKYLFPVKAMSKVFRGKYMSSLKGRIPEIPKDFISQCYLKNWVVYAKRQFHHPNHVIEYLGRYTHKVAISNNRLINLNGNTITFKAKNYKKGGVKEDLTLPQQEFLRRFGLHILPKKFVRIRHYGILSSTSKHIYIPLIRNQIDDEEKTPLTPTQAKPYDPSICPHCGTATMVLVDIIPSRGPPIICANTKASISITHHVASR